MMKFKVKTKGHTDFINITDKIQSVVDKAGIREGIAVAFVAGSTVALTIIEYEEGVMEDVRRALDKIAPEDFDYLHHRKWGDHNGAAHIRAALIGPDIVIPIAKGKLVLGSWQQVVLIDFDEKSREREVAISLLAN